MTDLNSGELAREVIADYLFSQVIGSNKPHPSSTPLKRIDAGEIYELGDSEDWGEFHDEITGFPILQNTRPEMVFGTGIIHSPENASDKFLDAPISSDDSSEQEEGVDYSLPLDFEIEDLPEIDVDLSDDPAIDTFGIEKTQQKRPSAMGLTALALLEPETEIQIILRGSTYSSFDVTGKYIGKSKWHRRNAHESITSVFWKDIASKSNQLILIETKGSLTEYLTLRLRWRDSKTQEENGSNLVALTVVAEHAGNKKDDVFQFEIEIVLLGNGYFASTDQTRANNSQNLEDQEVDFLYRHVGDYAVGHGTSVEWEQTESEPLKRVKSVSIPQFDQEVLNTKIQGLEIGMLSLANGTPEEIRATLELMVEKYENWNLQEGSRSTNLPDHQQLIHERLSNKVKHIIARMKKGIEVLFDLKRPEILVAFRLTNEAMYLQQRNGGLPKRDFTDEKNKPLSFPPLDYSNTGNVGTWFPFQIGFLLMTLPGIVDPLDDSREEVDLIFFPTGGGKTEAYLGAAALTMFLRRLDSKEHSGVDVLMRYTLRLLTVQQFERTSGLITAMEHIRRKDPQKFGATPFSIGVWLGSSTSPNSRKEGVALLNPKKRLEDNQENPFILSRCPWCGAAFGINKTHKSMVGYTESSTSPKKLIFQCGDRDNCEFATESKALPIWITDEDVYEAKPSFVLATVDKFARLAWVPESRALFNIDSSGNRAGLPPALIIQDELHLISGPLGSMVGLYEPVIEELCSFEISGKKIKPKIIASTATTRNYESQSRALYGRDSITLFPQSVNRANESFFSTVARDSSGSPLKGTKYLGLFPATYATGQLASAQVAAILSQAPNADTQENEAIDFYSTSMWFFNSLKELGQTLTLLQSTTVALLKAMWLDRRTPSRKSRSLERILELTSRISSAEISKSLEQLAIKNSSKGSVHTCLASSIMEVGVDVQRLGLLTIMSQPKLTAQYIQVSGRVGRARAEGPGLVVMLYNTNRTRDRSVYERFPTFHKRLYANVEPLSVTSFAVQTLQKGLAGSIIALYRMWSPSNQSATELDEALFDKVVEVLKVRLLDLPKGINNLKDFEDKVQDLKSRWLRYQPTNWEYTYQQKTGQSTDASTALMRGERDKLYSIPNDDSIYVPNSMRNVDGQTGLRVVANPYGFVGVEGKNDGD